MVKFPTDTGLTKMDRERLQRLEKNVPFLAALSQCLKQANDLISQDLRGIEEKLQGQGRLGRYNYLRKEVREARDEQRRYAQKKNFGEGSKCAFYADAVAKLQTLAERIGEDRSPFWSSRAEYNTLFRSMLQASEPIVKLLAAIPEHPSPQLTHGIRRQAATLLSLGKTESLFSMFLSSTVTSAAKYENEWEMRNPKRGLSASRNQGGQNGQGPGSHQADDGNHADGTTDAPVLSATETTPSYRISKTVDGVELDIEITPDDPRYEALNALMKDEKGFVAKLEEAREKTLEEMER